MIKKKIRRRNFKTEIDRNITSGQANPVCEVKKFKYRDKPNTMLAKLLEGTQKRSKLPPHVMTRNGALARSSK